MKDKRRKSVLQKDAPSKKTFDSDLNDSYAESIERVIKRISGIPSTSAADSDFPQSSSSVETEVESDFTQPSSSLETTPAKKRKRKNSENASPNKKVKTKNSLHNKSNISVNSEGDTDLNDSLVSNKKKRTRKSLQNNSNISNNSGADTDLNESLVSITDIADVFNSSSVSHHGEIRNKENFSVGTESKTQTVFPKRQKSKKTILNGVPPSPSKKSVKSPKVQKSPLVGKKKISSLEDSPQKRNKKGSVTFATSVRRDLKSIGGLTALTMKQERLDTDKKSILDPKLNKLLEGDSIEAMLKLIQEKRVRPPYGCPYSVTGEIFVLLFLHDVLDTFYKVIYDSIF